MMIVSDIVRAGAVASIVVALVAPPAHVRADRDRRVPRRIDVRLLQRCGDRSAPLGRPVAAATAAAAAEQARFSTMTIVAPPLGGALFGIGRALPVSRRRGLSVFSLALAARDPHAVSGGARPGRRAARARSSPKASAGSGAVPSCARVRCSSPGRTSSSRGRARAHRRRPPAGPRGAAIGGLIAALGASRWRARSRRPGSNGCSRCAQIIVGAIWLSLSLAAFVVKPNIYVLLAAALPMSFVVPTVTSVVIGYRVAVVPDRLTGRVNSAARSTALAAAARPARRPG